MWFDVVGEVVRAECGEEGEEDPLVSMETQLQLQRICANITHYCCKAMTLGGTLPWYLLCWNLLKRDTTGTKENVLIREVSSFQRVKCIIFVNLGPCGKFTCSYVLCTITWLSAEQNKIVLVKRIFKPHQRL